MREEGIVLRSYTGSEITPSVVDHAFVLYSDTVNKHMWGRQYLNRAFFEEVAGSMPQQLHIVLAHDENSSEVLGGAFNLLGHDTLYGRYWGAKAERRFLHFNVCYYEGVRECIGRGLARFEPGAGGEHKLARGFEATITHSTHYLADERLDAAISDFLRRERRAIDQELSSARRESAFKTR
jgi:predicted N-acyltransferase